MVMVPAVRGVVGDELDGLHDPLTGLELDEPGFHDIRVGAGLAGRGRCVAVGQDQPVRPARPCVEPLEPPAHPVRE
jgi:hypothetical protein